MSDDALRTAIALAAERHHIPGVVIGISCAGNIRVDAVGFADIDGVMPMQEDALFRITSMSRPITAFATLLLVDDGVIEVDETVDRLLPELADRRVLRRLDGPIEDTEPARRPITIRDLLTFRGGFGIILDDPSNYPILQAEAAHQLRSAGPPIPVTSHPPDEWIRRLGSLPLMDQPGTRWRYSTGSQILGVLIARAAGQDLESFYRDRIFAPLGMTDTGFTATDPSRLVPCKAEGPARIEDYDDGGTWLSPRVFPDGGGGLVSTVSDYLRFGRMLAAGGIHDGRRLLSADLVRQMTTDQLTAEQRSSADMILGGRGWGYGLSIIDTPGSGQPGPKGYGWSGGFGTQWFNDSDEELVAVLAHQVLLGDAALGMETDIWQAVYAMLGG